MDKKGINQNLLLQTRVGHMQHKAEKSLHSNEQPRTRILKSTRNCANSNTAETIVRSGNAFQCMTVKKQFDCQKKKTQAKDFCSQLLNGNVEDVQRKELNSVISLNRQFRNP